MVLKKMYIRQIKQVSVDKRTNVREIECPITTRSSIGPLTWICLICREPGFSRKLTRLVLHIASSFFTVLCLNTIFRDDILSGLNLTRRLLFLDDLLIVNDLVVSRWVTPHCWALWWFVVVRVCSYAYYTVRVHYFITSFRDVMMIDVVSSPWLFCSPLTCTGGLLPCCHSSLIW